LKYLPLFGFSPFLAFLVTFLGALPTSRAEEKLRWKALSKGNRVLFM